MKYQRGFLAPCGRPARQPAALPDGRKRLLEDLVLLLCATMAASILEFAEPLPLYFQLFCQAFMWWGGFLGVFGGLLPLYLFRDEYRWK